MLKGCPHLLRLADGQLQSFGVCPQAYRVPVEPEQTERFEGVGGAFRRSPPDAPEGVLELGPAPSRLPPVEPRPGGAWLG